MNRPISSHDVSLANAQDNQVLLFSDQDDASTFAGWIVAAGLEVIRISGLRRVLAETAAGGHLHAIVDCRGAAGPGERAIRLLSRARQNVPGALIALVDRADAPQLPTLMRRGATHFILVPGDPAQFVQQVLFAVHWSARTARALADRRGNALAASLRPAVTWLQGTNRLTVPPAAAHYLGLVRGNQSVPPRALLRRIVPDDRAVVLAAVRVARRQGYSADITVRVPMSEDGSQLLRATLRYQPTDGLEPGVISAALEQASAGRSPQLFDPLTGLPNNEFARSWIQLRLAESEDLQIPVGLLLLSVSRFDTLNASYGRATADGVLRQVARRMVRTVARWESGSSRSGEAPRPLVSRLGGASFLIAIPGPLLVQSAMLLGQQLGAMFERQFRIQGRWLELSCRIGATFASGTDTTADELMREATMALAEARLDAPNGIAVHSSTTTNADRTRALVEADLRQAIRRNELSIVYQPQVSTIDASIVGCEALVRWMHPSMGPVDPAQFIEIAENAEFIGALDEWVLRKTLEEVSRWSGFLRARLKLSVNLSASQLHRTDLAHWIAQLLAANRIEPERLVVEVTESAVIRNIDEAARQLRAIRQLGARVALDDFGSGHSNFAYLKHLPVDAIKLDRSFVTAIASEQRDRTLVRAMISMGRALGFTVVAEGVETLDQLRVLRREGCDRYQGFLCSTAMTAKELEAFARRWTALHENQPQA